MKSPAFASLILASLSFNAFALPESQPQPLLGELREAETAVNEAVLKPAGLLRVQASLSFSMIVIAPLLS